LVSDYTDTLIIMIDGGINKKVELVLMRRAKAYSSSGSVV